MTEDIRQPTNIRCLFLSDNAISCIPVELSLLPCLIHLGLNSTKKDVPLAVFSLQTFELQHCAELDRRLKEAYTTTGRVDVIDHLKQAIRRQLRRHQMAYNSDRTRSCAFEIWLLNQSFQPTQCRSLSRPTRQMPMPCTREQCCSDNTFDWCEATSHIDN